MKRARRAAIAIGWAAWLLPAAAGSLEPKKASELLVLTMGADACAQPGYRRLNDDGGAPFVVPPRRAFVVTGFGWSAGGVSQGTTNFAVLATVSGRELVRSPAVATASLLAANEDLALPQIAVASGEGLCAGVPGNTDLAFARVYGFLAPDR